MAIGTPTRQGSGTGTGTGSSQNLITAINVSAGAQLYLLLALTSTTAPTTISDGSANVYTLIGSGVTVAGLGLFVYEVPSSAVLSNATLSAVMANTSRWVAILDSDTGLVSSSPLDRQTGTTGTSTAPASGNTAATTQASELAMGFIAWLGGSNASFTAGASYTQVAAAVDNSTLIGANTEYQILSATGVQNAGATLGASETWAAQVATFKAPVAAVRELMLIGVGT